MKREIKMLNKIYNISPVWVQNLMCSVQSLAIKRRRYSKRFFAELELFEQGLYSQSVELVKMLRSIKEMPVYASCLSNVNFDLLDKDPLLVYDVFQRFPIIDKTTVRSNMESYTNFNYCGKKITMHTSGTTGSGLIFPYSVEMENKQWAVWWRFRRALGIQLDTWCGWLGGRMIIPLESDHLPYWRVNHPGKQVMYSSYHLNKKNIHFYYEDIKKRNLTWLHGYPSSTSLLASLIVEQELEPIESVRWVTTGAENLTENHINRILRAFPNAMVRTHYGLSEGVANFSQNKEGKWRIDDDFAFVEFIPVSDTESTICKIVGTGFSNLAFPLVRYDTGDLVKIDIKEGKPEIVEIYGRQDDYVELPNGVKLGRLGYVFKVSVNVKESQIHQIRKDLIELKIVKDWNYSERDEILILNEATSRFGKDVKIIITYCEIIERTKSGKLKFVVSDIK